MRNIVKLTESDLNKIVRRILSEANDDNEKYEKGKYGVRASRSRGDFEPTPKESDIIEKLFGKYGNDVPPIVIRYLRKLGKKTLTKRLMDLKMLDKDMLEEE